jgi:hypothetical protein
MVFIVSCLLHGGFIFVLIHVKAQNKSPKRADQPLTIFLVKPQPAIAIDIALPSQFMIGGGSSKGQKNIADSQTRLPEISIPVMDSQASEDAPTIDWTGESQRSAEAIASRAATGGSDSSATAAGSAPWNPHPGRLESTAEGLKLRLIDPCFALLHNWTHDPLVGTKGDLQVNCNWKKPPPRGDLFDSIRPPSSDK